MSAGTRLARSVLVWTALAAGILVPIGLAATSPLLAWRNAIYIAAGFAGIIALGLMLLQPVLMAGFIPDLAPMRARRLHRGIGGVLAAAVVLHVAGLWVTSPPDVIDALTFSSPTPFSVWGVTAMWAVVTVAALAALRSPWRLRPRTWRIAHLSLAVIAVGGSVVHALLIEGAMETVSKAVLCGLLVAATVWIVLGLRARQK